MRHVARRLNVGGLVGLRKRLRRLRTAHDRQRAGRRAHRRRRALFATIAGHPPGGPAGLVLTSEQ